MQNRKREVHWRNIENYIEMLVGDDAKKTETNA